jgi:hypothetical protein
MDGEIICVVFDEEDTVAQLKHKICKVYFSGESNTIILSTENESNIDDKLTLKGLGITPESLIYMSVVKLWYFLHDMANVCLEQWETLKARNAKVQLVGSSVTHNSRTKLLEHCWKVARSTMQVGTEVVKLEVCFATDLLLFNFSACAFFVCADL